MTQFEWDPIKALSNQRKHGVLFEEAMHVFEDPNALFEQDPSAKTGELRWRALGLAGGLAILLVVHTVREVTGGDIIRLISARRATRKERNNYEKTCAQDTGE
jgi:uncharacterized DUF497 family protein